MAPVPALQDTLALRAKNFGKKLGTRSRYSALLGVIVQYMTDQKKAEVILDYLIDGKSGNTATVLAAGMRWINVYVQTITSMDEIVLQCQISPNAITITAV